MPRNGSGTYTLPEPAFVAGTIISSSAVNSDLTDIATALTGSLPRDGQAGMTGHLTLVDASAANPALGFNNEDSTGFYRAGAGQLGVSILGTSVGLFTSIGWQGFGSVPVGIVSDFAGSSAPTGWLLCYGQNVSRTTYAALFAVIGTTYGSGDGSTTFGLPDLRGAILYGKANMGGSTSSRITSTYFNADPTTLGIAGGFQTSQLLTTHLPAYTPTGSVIINDPGHLHGGVAQNNNNTSGSYTFAALANTYINDYTRSTNSATTGITASFSGTAQGGAATAFSNLPPGVIMNKIIYAGA